MADKKEDLHEAAEIVKGYAKRLAGEITGRPDSIVEGEKEQTEALHRIRRERDAKNRSH